MRNPKNFSVPKMTLLLSSLPVFCMAQEKPKLTNNPPAATEHTVILSAETMFAEKYSPFPKGTTFWTPEPADIALLEADLKKLAKDPAVLNSPRNQHHSDIFTYYRQYVGIVQNGKRQIYVNGLCSLNTSDIYYWRRHIVFVYDGGSGFYHVSYDVKTQRFDEVRFNGVA